MDIKKDHWRICSTCKKPIDYASAYYTCSVSTCNQLRTGLVFCSVSCFDRHLPGARHRDASAVEEIAPSQENAAQAVPASVGARRIIAGPQSQKRSEEVLVVTSKLKAYIKERSDMNTSGSVMEVLSEMIRHSCDLAIENARQDGRKTVMDRDFKKS
jgi:histone H3/H4